MAGLIPALRRRADGRSWAVVTLRPGARRCTPWSAPSIRRRPTWPRSRRPRAPSARSSCSAPTRACSPRMSAACWRPRRSAAPTGCCSTSTSGRSSTPRPCAIRPPTRQAEPTSPASSTCSWTPPAPAPARSCSPPAPTSTATCCATRRLAAAVPPGLVNLGPLSRADLARAIREPASAVGLAVDGPLVETMLDAVAEDTPSCRCSNTRSRRPGSTAASASPATASAWTTMAPPAASTAPSPSAPTSSRGLDEADRRPRAACSSAWSPPARAARTRAPGWPTRRPRHCGRGPHLQRRRGAPAGHRRPRGSRRGCAACPPPGRDQPRDADPRMAAARRQWIEANRETLRRRERVRDWMAAWEERGRDPSLLLPPGLALEVGRELLEDHGDVLIDEVRPYIEASLAADEARSAARWPAKAEAERRARARRGSAAGRRAAQADTGSFRRSAWCPAACRCLPGGSAWRGASRARPRQIEQARAEFNLSAAARAADGLVFDLAQGLRDGHRRLRRHHPADPDARRHAPRRPRPRR